MLMVRVFAERTLASPTDEMSYFGGPPLYYAGDETVHVSCSFSWTKRRAERLAELWRQAGYPDVQVGGPAYGDRGGDFTPGRYLAKGYVITSRGCNNRCWFCDVWQREGQIRELPITGGWIVCDSNLLQCSRQHIEAVFAMLAEQTQPAQFKGGFEAAILEDWHVELLAALKTRRDKRGGVGRLYFAYDTPEDYEPLRRAAKMVFEAGFSPRSHNVCAYVLIGFAGDTFEKAEARLRQVVDLGVTPFAMLYIDQTGYRNPTWSSFQREWARQAIIYASDLIEEQSLFERAGS